jgi:hypothetical protein
MQRFLGHACLVIWICAVAIALPAQSFAKGPVVFELFSTKACTYGDEAAATFRGYAGQGNVIALACYVGDFFSDIYANDACRDRQSSYTRRFSLGGVRTPLVILNGMYDMSGRSKTIHSGMSLARSTGRISELEVVENGGRATFSLPSLNGVESDRNFDVTLYKYKGVSQEEPNIVFNIKSLEEWNGSAASFGFDVAGGEFSYAVLVQKQVSGEVIAAGILEP